MPNPGESHNSSDDTNEEKFLFAEYQALIDLDSSRNERLDRFLTIFMTLAAAPWALYALVLKDHSGSPSFSAVPSPVAAAFVLIGILGALVAMMFIQMRFTIILYTRALNAVRGYFLTAETPLTFRLPSDPTKPPYYERGNYIQFAVAGMALVDSGYIALGLYNLITWPGGFAIHLGIFILLGIVCWIGHMSYYSGQARRRESHSRGTNELRWGK
jgi:hypothetical protein